MIDQKAYNIQSIIYLKHTVAVELYAVQGGTFRRVFYFAWGGSSNSVSPRLPSQVALRPTIRLPRAKAGGSGITSCSTTTAAYQLVCPPR